VDFGLISRIVVIPIRKKNLSGIFLRVPFLIIFINDIRSKKRSNKRRIFIGRCGMMPMALCCWNSHVFPSFFFLLLQFNNSGELGEFYLLTSSDTFDVVTKSFFLLLHLGFWGKEKKFIH
jgi:hypothetical protein